MAAMGWTEVLFRETNVVEITAQCSNIGFIINNFLQKLLNKGPVQKRFVFDEKIGPNTAFPPHSARF
jgi:hypothetical protein